MRRQISQINIIMEKIDAKETGLDQKSEVLVDKIRALDNRIFLEELDARESRVLLEKLQSIIDF